MIYIPKNSLPNNPKINYDILFIIYCSTILYSTKLKIHSYFSFHNTAYDFRYASALNLEPLFFSYAKSIVCS